MKRPKFFYQTIQNLSLRSTSNYLEIIYALINALRPRCVPDLLAGSEVAYYMLEKFNQQNNIQLRLPEIAKERFDWKTYDARVCLFPELSQDDVRTLCCGMIMIQLFIL